MMQQGTFKILVVDDEENVRNLVQRMLQGFGSDVYTATDGNEALNIVGSSDIGVMLLDMKMPGMTGMEVLQQVSVYHPDICVIMVTAIDDANSAIEAIKLGAYDYITKPFNKDDLIFRVQRAVEKRDLKQMSKKYLKTLEEKVQTQAAKLQEYFAELVANLTREHNLLFGSVDSKSREGRAHISKLPRELQKPMSSMEEYRDALLKILRRTV